MKSGQFTSDFRNLTDNDPFPWQEKLYEQMREGRIPKRCDIPTGLGKTSVIACWLLARERQHALPRRLVYVVNRRTVVDQTTDEVEKIRRNLHKIGKDESALAISTLRGQHADNHEWSADPSKPAVICGTVDMIGSRLLFAGYGVGRNGKPLHAGFLGQDALIVHDEAHLEPAFQELLLSIEREQTMGRFPPDFRPLSVMELSATSRSTANDKPFELTPAEKAATKDSAGVLAEVGKRIRANKAIQFPQIDDERKQLADKLAELALAHEKEPGRAILIFVRTVDDLTKVVAKLPNDRTRQLTGTMRGLEREALVRDSIFARFLPKAEKGEQTVYLVCTSAGEVGVNISADHLVCDLSTFESMAQRFGRVNRFGKCHDTQIDVVHPTSFEDKPLEQARKRTLELLKNPLLQGSVNSAALSLLDPKARADAFAPQPAILPATNILFDAWNMTSITGKMPGRPSVEPYLHGIADWEPPQTQVAWREEVGQITPDMFTDYPPQELLEAYPLKSHEWLTDRTDRIWKELCELGKRFGDRPIWIVDTDGTVDTSKKLSDLSRWDVKQRESELEDQIVLLPHGVDGLTPQGLLKGDTRKAIKPNQPADPINNDVADAILDKDGNAIRRRVWSDDPDFDSLSAGLRLVYRIDMPATELDEDEPARSWLWFEAPIPADNSRHSVHPVLWQTHINDVTKRASEIAERLNLDPTLRTVIRLAAAFHDLGKRRDLWQRMIGRPSQLTQHWFAKSGKCWKGADKIKYRHEFGSLLDLAKEPEFQSLDADSKELVLHLVAAHHGMARPHFDAEQTIDLEHPQESIEQLASEIPRRFARLQRKFGRWGLAYLESLLRAADWGGSAEPSEYFTEEAP